MYCHIHKCESHQCQCNNGLNNQMIYNIIEDRVTKEVKDVQYLHDSLKEFVSTLSELISGQYTEKHIKNVFAEYSITLEESLKIPQLKTELEEALRNLETQNNLIKKHSIKLDEWLEEIPKLSKYIQVLESVADLSTIKNPAEGLCVYVKSYHAGFDVGGGYFIYDESKKEVNNSGTIINGWVRVNDLYFFDVTNFGALGDGKTDSTSAINKTIEVASKVKGSTVFIPDGVYMVKAHIDNNYSNHITTETGIILRSNTHLRLSDGAVLKAIPNGYGAYNIVFAREADNITIQGGTIQGDRYEHTTPEGFPLLKAVEGATYTEGQYIWYFGSKIYKVTKGGVLSGLTKTVWESSNTLTLGETTLKLHPTNARILGEWGYGIAIVSCTNIDIMDIKVKDCWGDGINLQAFHSDYPNKNIRIKRVECDNNRRQGLSVESLLTGEITESVFKNTNGTAPQAGIDFEPVLSQNLNRDIKINSCLFDNNGGCGIVIHGSANKYITVDSCTFTNNKDGEGQFVIFDSSGFCSLSNSLIKGGSGALISDTSNCSITSCTLIDTKYSGIRSIKEPSKTYNNTFKDNKFLYETTNDWFSFSVSNGCKTSIVSGNTWQILHDNYGDKHAIRLASECMFKDNTIIGAYTGIEIVAENISIINNDIHLVKGVPFVTSSALNNLRLVDNRLYAISFSSPNSAIIYGVKTLTNSVIEGNTIYINSPYRDDVFTQSRYFTSLNSVENCKIINNKTASVDKKRNFHPLMGTSIIEERVLTNGLQLNIIGDGTIPSGKASEKPFNAMTGDLYIDTEKGEVYTCLESGTITSSGNPNTYPLWIASYIKPLPQVKTSGTTEQRPTGVATGFMYFDTTLSKPVWWNGNDWVDTSV